MSRLQPFLPFPKYSLGGIDSSSSVWLRRLGCLWLAASWLVPNHYRPWVAFHLEFVAFVGLAFLFAACLLEESDKVPVPAMAIWIAIMAMIPWLQYAAGISLFAGDALLSSLYLIGLATAVAAGYCCKQTRPAFVVSLMHALWIAALLSAFIGLLQWLYLQEWLGIYVVQVDPGDRALGNLGQPNQLATLLLMGMVALAYVYELRLLGSAGFALAVAFMSYVLVLTQSRSGMLGLLVVAGFLLAKREPASRIQAKHLVAWVVSFLLLTLLFPALSRGLLLGGVRESLGTTSDRLLIWSQVLDGVLKAPWWGYGWNQTPTAHMAGAPAHPGDITYTYAHNVVLDLLAWVGLPIGIFLVGVGIYWFVTRMARVRQPVAIYAMAILLPFAIHSLLEFPFTYGYFLLWAGLMAGVVEASLRREVFVSIRKRWLWAGFAAWVVVGGAVAREYLLIEEDFRIVRFENMRIGETEASYEVPDVWMSTQMAAMLYASRQRARPGMTPAEIENLRRVALRFPWGALTFRYAMALGLNNDLEGASKMMLLIHSMYGTTFYNVVREELEDMKKTYPQLEMVHAPDLARSGAR